MKTLLIATVLLLNFAHSAIAQVAPANRALIIVNELDSAGIPELAPLYRTLEDLTVALPSLPIVRNSYREIHVLRNDNATLTRFRATSRALAARSEIQAIDVFMVLHGSPNKLKFRDGTVKMEDLVPFMLASQTPAQLAIVNQMRTKFRIMYNTSCFGASHRGAFRSIGFDVASGSIGVNANSEAEYPSFLGLWNLGQTFGGSIAPTNTSPALLVTDGPLVAAGNFMNNSLKFVNSRKVFSGNTNIRIDSSAQ